MGRGLVAAAALVVVAACGAAPAPKAAPPAPSPPPPAPAVGACRILSFAAAASASDATATTSCARPHTAVTVAVGTFANRAQLKTTDVNSAAVQHELAVSCPRAVGAYAGGSRTTYNLSLVEAVWFLPTPAQIAQGANWYRCDLVVLASPNTLSRLIGTMRNSLAPGDALSHWGTCGTTSPSAKGFRRVVCSAPHAWRAVALVNLPQKSAYLSKGVADRAGQTCRGIAAKAANGALKYSWSFEWPNRPQWQAGQRFGLCWLPRSH